MSADGGGPPPGGAAPQDERYALLARIGYLADPCKTVEGANEALAEIRQIVSHVLRAAPPDAGRDAGGAPSENAISAYLAAYDTDVRRASPNGVLGASYRGASGQAEQYANLGRWIAAAYAVDFPTGGRPAAEPPDVREAATILLAELWNRGWRGLTEADATAIAGKMFSRAALGAAPPTQEGA